MSKKEDLKRLENSLDVFTLGINLLKKGFGYYAYYNKPNEKRRTFKIHHSSCGNCAWGTGKISKAKPGKNGVWIGPFSNTNQAEEFLNDNFSLTNDKINICNCCK